jgi:hypothetical protein
MRLVFFMAFLVTLPGLSWEVGTTNAEPDSSPANKDLGAQTRESSTATRVRAQRANLLKRRREAQQQIQKAVEERQRQQQSATGAGIAAPDKADKGVPK